MHQHCVVVSLIPCSHLFVEAESFDSHFGPFVLPYDLSCFQKFIQLMERSNREKAAMQSITP